ncbi:RimJ/RimL family protein N-acetyltransferase [Caulobacter ginsengisoli]|uniref:RimJ/RimL family protein N-acetyltransferase n=1 Tax=Caulobacter ginsengisoli TaxID=400775 RepID=A0ABU0IQA8_9CAUL|nr:GNAT family N-acetyltransferase [Caulobacter ginsengisoli]MDQ0464198.1 RimJ/RimL family protein N-acetyltransferase [Caulobacter ginsengisoli]
MRPLETDRLRLLPLTLADAPAIQQRFPRWEIVRWMDAVIPWPYPDDGALTYLSKVALPAMAEGRAWHWSLRPRAEPQTLIGVISLMDQEDNNRGLWLSPEWQGQGLMTEAADAVTDFWFEDLDRSVLRIPKAAGNGPSRRLSERRGMRVIASFPKATVSGEHLSELWEITRDEWRAARSFGAHRGA